MKAGASMLSWIHPSWNDEAVLYAISKKTEQLAKGSIEFVRRMMAAPL